VGPEWIFAAVILLVVLLVAWTGRSSRRDGGSTAGHYDPDAIGGYTLDPATMRYRYDLPTLPRSSGPVPAGEGPPHRRRRRRRRPPDAPGG
jgi:hypothetical protein